MRKSGNSELEKRFYEFALQIIKIVNKLPKNVAGYAMGKQLFRSGTSIAANYAEAKGAFSKKDFLFKMNISFKEARETLLWLNLVNDSNMLTGIDVIIEEAKEIRNILGASVKTAKIKEKV